MHVSDLTLTATKCTLLRWSAGWKDRGRDGSETQTARWTVNSSIWVTWLSLLRAVGVVFLMGDTNVSAHHGWLFCLVARRVSVEAMCHILLQFLLQRHTLGGSGDRQTHTSSCQSSYKLFGFVVEYITFEVLGFFFFCLFVLWQNFNASQCPVDTARPLLCSHAKMCVHICVFVWTDTDASHQTVTPASSWVSCHIWKAEVWDWMSKEGRSRGEAKSTNGKRKWPKTERKASQPGRERYSRESEEDKNGEKVEERSLVIQSLSLATGGSMATFPLQPF